MKYIYLDESNYYITKDNENLWHQGGYLAKHKLYATFRQIFKIEDSGHKGKRVILSITSSLKKTVQY